MLCVVKTQLRLKICRGEIASNSSSPFNPFKSEASSLGKVEGEREMEVNPNIYPTAVGILELIGARWKQRSQAGS